MSNRSIVDARAELRRAMRTRGRELRRRLHRQRALQRQQFEQTPAMKQRRRQRRLRRALLIALILLLVSMLRCSCIVPLPSLGRQVVVQPAVLVPEKPAPFAGKLSKGRRAGYRGAAPTAPLWLDDFRLQVSARSPRLAQCFRGADKPGALRWTCGVNPATGAVSDHDLEPVGATAALNDNTRQCLVGVLTSPTYRLRVTPDAPSTPTRVGIVIEF